MSVDAIQEELEKKEDNAERIAGTVIEKSDLLTGVLDGVNSPITRVRFNSANVLRAISEKKPEILYPHFDFFERLLESENTIFKWNAIDIIANLAAVDVGNKLDRVFKKFHALLNEGTLITAAHVVKGYGKMARAKPGLQDRVTDELLSVDQVPLPTDECRNIVKGKAIDAFALYFGQARSKKSEIATFVKGQLNNRRGSTKKRAEAFLKRFAVA